MTISLDATTAPFALSLVTVTKGNASKRLIDNGQGMPTTDPAHGLWIAEGRVSHLHVPGLSGLRDVLWCVQKNQALVHGVPRGSAPGDVWQLVVAHRYTGAPGTIARTLDCFGYPTPLALIMLDYDPDPTAQVQVSSAEDLVRHMAGLWPVFSEVGYLRTTSTRSAIRPKGQPEAWLTPPHGMHVYLLVTGDIARFKELLKVKLWCAGLGFCKLATANKDTGVAAMLERALVDLTVLSPERLDYVAGAQIPKGAPFHQDRPPPELHAGCVLNLDELPDVTDAERQDYARRLDAAKALLAPEQRHKVRVHITARAPALPEDEQEREITRRIARAEQATLAPEHPLYFPTCTITAQELSTRAGKALDGRRLRDPQEPEYGPSQAVLHWNKGNWLINSWAHGILKTYRLAHPGPPPPDEDDTTNLLAQAAAPLDEHIYGTAAHPARDPDALPYSDYTNALALVRDHGANLRYCTPWGKWLVWTGTHWDMNNTGQVMRWAKDTIKRLARHAEDLDDLSAIGALLRHVKASLSTAKLKAMVENAESELPLPVLPDALDRDPWLLNVANGTLNLRTGALQPHTPTDLLTRCLPVRYDPHAVCPTWDAFLERIMAGNTTLIRFLQRAIGYALTGVIREHVLLILWGTGRNGKSTLLGVLLTLLGAYAMKAPAELLMLSYNDRHPTERADLFHKRFVAVIETEQGRRMAEVFVKEATGGDPITARRMREDFWTFPPTHKLFLATNHKPVIKGTDNAIWERMRLVPFTVTIPPAERDTTLPDKLAAEMAGILAWAVRGCQAWLQHGLGEPDEVQQATKGYRAEMDVLGGFIDDCCLTGPNYRVKAHELYEAYKRWCEQNGESIDPQRTWGMALTERGYEHGKVQGRSWWKGIALIQVDEVDEGRPISGIKHKKNATREHNPDFSSTSSTSSTSHGDAKFDEGTVR